MVTDLGECDLATATGSEDPSPDLHFLICEFSFQDFFNCRPALHSITFLPFTWVEMYNTAYIHFGDMKFIVILCPRCKTAKGALAGTKTTNCAKCQKNINLKKARVLAKVDYESELAKMVGEINMKIQDGEDIFQMDLDSLMKEGFAGDTFGEQSHKRYDKIAGMLSEVSGKDNKIVEAAKLLQMAVGDFSEEDFFEVLKRIGITDTEQQEETLIRLLENNVLYQPKIGIYRFLEN
jgi:hypothetical protein